MASSSSSLKTCLVLLFLLAAAIMTFPGVAAVHSLPPSPVKCIHHHAKLTACANFLKDKDDVEFSKPTQACCKNYMEIFRSGTPTCLCRYLHPEKLRTWFSVTKLMSLHDVCPQSSSFNNMIPLYDLCVGLQDPQEKFDGILEVINKDHPKNPFMSQANRI